MSKLSIIKSVGFLGIFMILGFSIAKYSGGLMEPDELDPDFLSKCNNIDTGSYKTILGSYGYDKNGIYYGCYKTQAKDIDNFKVIDRDFWRNLDKNYVYRNFISIDKNNVYFQGDLLPGMNPSKLRLVKSNIKNENLDHIQDDNSFTCGNQYFIGINGDKLIIIYQSGGSFIRDDKSVFAKGGSFCDTVIGADPKTFEVYIAGLGLYKDKYSVYVGNKKIIGADPKTFQVIGNRYRFVYAKDKNNVYLNNNWDRVTIVKGADPKTFELYDNDNQIYKDKNHVYRGNKIITGADPKTFQIISEKDGSEIINFGYAKDKNHIYYYIRENINAYIVVKGADPKTFKLYNKDKQIYKDKKNKYQNGKMIK